MRQSLGLIEVTELALAISVSDAMAKVASIQLLGIEKAKDSGWMVVQIAGDVASVEAAIATGAEFARQRNGLVSHRVISRSAEGLTEAFARQTGSEPANPAPDSDAVSPAVESTPLAAKPASQATVKSAKPRSALKATPVAQKSAASKPAQKAVEPKPAAARRLAAVKTPPKPETKITAVVHSAVEAKPESKPVVTATPPLTDRTVENGDAVATKSGAKKSTS